MGGVWDIKMLSSRTGMNVGISLSARHRLALNSDLPKPLSPYFSGISDDLEAKKKTNMNRENRLREAALTEERKKLLEKPMLTLNNRGFNGLEVLQLVEEMTSKDIWQAKPFFKRLLRLGMIIGTLGIVIPYKRDSFYDDDYHKFMSDIHTGVRANAIANLSSEGQSTTTSDVSYALRELQRAGLLTSNNYDTSGTQKWKLSALGKQVLATQGRTLSLTNPTAESDAAQTQSTPSTETKKKDQTVPPAPAELDTVRLFLQQSEDGQSGWSLLQTIADLEMKPFTHQQLVFSGVDQNILLEHLKSKHPAVTVNLLTALAKDGYLKRSKSIIGSAIRWIPTAKATTLLAQGKNVYETSLVTHERLGQLLQQETVRLNGEKSQRLKQMEQLNARMREAETQLELLNRQAETSRLDALSSYNEAQKAENPQDKVMLEDRATEKALQCKTLKQEIVLQEGLMKQLKLEIALAKSVYESWRKQMHRDMEQLSQAQMKLKGIELNRNLARLMNELKAMDNASSTANQKPSPVMEEIESEFFRTQSQYSEEEIRVLLEARKHLHESELSQIMQEIEAAPANQPLREMVDEKAAQADPEKKKASFS